MRLSKVQSLPHSPVWQTCANTEQAMRRHAAEQLRRLIQRRLVGFGLPPSRKLPHFGGVALCMSPVAEAFLGGFPREGRGCWEQCGASGAMLYLAFPTARPGHEQSVDGFFFARRGSKLEGSWPPRSQLEGWCRTRQSSPFWRAASPKWGAAASPFWPAEGEKSATLRPPGWACCSRAPARTPRPRA